MSEIIYDSAREGLTNLLSRIQRLGEEGICLECLNDKAKDAYDDLINVLYCHDLAADR